MRRSQFVAVALAMVACGGEPGMDDPAPTSSSEAALGKKHYKYSSPASDHKWETGWLLRGGGELSVCSPSIPYLCYDDARFSAVWPHSDGSVLAAGAYTGHFTLGSDEYQSTTSIYNYPFGWPVSEVFLAKVSASGDVLWTRSFGGRDDDWVYEVVEDGLGNIYLTGTFAVPLTFGQTTLHTHGSVDVFVAKLDSMGNPIWATSGGGVAYDYANGLVLQDDHIYITGTTTGAATFGTVAPQALGGVDAFVASLDSNTGEWEWAQTIGGAGLDLGRTIARTNGGVVIGGRLSGTVTVLGSAQQTEGDSDAFVAKVSPEGGLVWARLFGGLGSATVEHLSTHASSSDIAVGGYSEGALRLGTKTHLGLGENDGFVALLGATGSVKWSSAIGGPSFDRTSSVALAPSGRVFVTGSFSATAALGPRSLSSAGGLDVFVGEIYCGTWKDALRAGGTGDDTSRRIVNLGDKTLWVAGTARAGHADFGAEAAEVGGYAEAFLWQLKPTKTCGSH